ncbi:hypothetical protein [Pacificispira sp.]
MRIDDEALIVCLCVAALIYCAIVPGRAPILPDLPPAPVTAKGDPEWTRP